MKLAQWIAVFLLFASPAFAQSALQDLDTYFQNKSLAVAFPDGITVQSLSESCLFICDRFQYQTQSKIKSETEVLLQTITGNHVSSEDVMTEKKWADLHGNLVRNLTRNLESYGFVLQYAPLETADDTLKIQGQIRTIKTKVLRLSGTQASGLKESWTLVLSNEFGGLGQILSLENRSSSKKELRRALEVTGF